MADTGTMAKNGLPGPGIWLSVLITLVGATLATVGGWQTFQQTFELLTADSFAVPGSEVRDLPPGEYEVYGLVAEVSLFNLDESTFLNEPTFFVDDITVTNLDTNSTVPLIVEDSNVTLSRSSNVYAPVASFDIAQEGEYEISIQTDGNSRSVVGRSIQSAPDRIVPWVIMLIVGSVLTLIGLAMLITGIVRRSRIKKQPGYTGVNAPAGYAAPQSAPATGSITPPPVPPSVPSSAPPLTPPASSPPPPPGTSAPSEVDSPTPNPPRPNQDPHQPDTNTPWG